MAAVAGEQSADPPRGSIPIEVELGAGCAALIRAQRLEVFRERLAGEVDDMLARLGLAGRATVAVTESSSRRAVRIRVRGRLQPYPAGLPQRLWRMIAPAELLDLPEEREHADGGPADGWFSEYVAGLAEDSDAPDLTLAFELVQRVVREALWERAGCLVGVEQADAFLRGATLPAEPPIDSRAMVDVLCGLADLAIPVHARDRLIRTVERCTRQALSREDTFEEALAALRPKRIEILADGGSLQELVRGEPLRQPLSVHDERVENSARDAFLALEKELLLGRGVQVPAMELVPSWKLRPGMTAVRINGHSSPLPLGAGRLTLEGLMPTLADELRRRAHLLLDVQEVACRVGQLQEMFPALVEALIGRLSLPDLTRILRELLREGVSIHDLKTVFGLLLEFDTVPADPQRYVVLDERLPLANRAGRGREDWRSRLEFVRRGLAYQLSAAHSRGGRLDAIVIDPAPTSGDPPGRGGGGEALGEAEQEAVRDALWTQLERVGGAASRPVVYTAGGARSAIRELLAPEYPGLPVLAAAEVRRGIEVHELARLRLPGAAS